MSAPHSVALPEGIEGDAEKLFEHATSEFGAAFSASNCDISAFTPVTVQLFEPDLNDRVIVYKPIKEFKIFGVLRVYKKETGEEEEVGGAGKKKGQWDNVRGKGAHMGLIPAGCRFEAMHVEVRFITPKTNDSTPAEVG